MKYIALTLPLVASPVLADAPRVVTDIAPVHSLVSIVMEGVGTPELVIPTNASPHDFAFRPSQAEMLTEADAVIWIGHALTPWLEDPIEELASSAAVLELIDADGVTLLPFREGALFEGGAHDHANEDGHDDHDHDKHAEEGHDDHGHEDHAEDGHDDHDHEDHAADKHEDHAEDAHDDHDHAKNDHDDHAGHDHAGGDDPHIWLSPDNGAAFLSAIATQLSEIDPEHAETYRANAAQGRARMVELETEVNAILEPVRGTPFIVLHDAFHYFEDSFEFEATGAISPSDAASPSAGRVALLRDALQGSSLKCAFTEPQQSGRIIETVIEGMDVQTSVLDPLGSEIALGSGLYPELLTQMGRSMAECLGR